MGRIAASERIPWLRAGAAVAPSNAVIDWSNPVAQNLVGAWFLNSGSPVDLVGQSQSVVSSNTAGMGSYLAPTLVAGPSGPAALFNGTSQYFGVLRGNAGLYVSVIAWIVAYAQLNPLSASLGILGSVNNGNIEFRINSSSGRLEVLAQGQKSFGTSPSNAPLNQFVQVGCSIDSTTGNYAFYLNGQQQNSGSGGGNNFSASGGFLVGLGEHANTPYEYFYGLIDHVKVYNAVMPPSVFALEYANRKAFLRPKLVPQGRPTSSPPAPGAKRAQAFIIT